MTHAAHPDYPHYLITSDGMVLSQHRGTTTPLRSRRDGRGYLCINLIAADGQRRTVKLHRLVWEAHRGPIPSGCHVDHANHDRLDARLSNLRLREASENSADCRRGPRSGIAQDRQLAKDAAHHLRTAGWPTHRIAAALAVGATTVRRWARLAVEN